MNHLTAVVQSSETRADATNRSAANIGRIAWGIFFLVCSVFNLFVTVPHPEFYGDFADLTFFPFYRGLLLNIAEPYGVWISSLVVIFELVTGILILSKNTPARVGLLFTALWLVFLFPSMGWYSLGTPLLLVIPILLLRYDYPRSLVELIFRRGF